MATRRTKATTKKATVLGSTSWMALLAATTLGVDGASTVRAEVRADADLADAREYRLVVQSYDAEAGSAPSFRARPVGSFQRAVTAAELRRGVQVSLVELRQAGAADDGAVVAWVEAGKPDLEFDGRTARPGPGMMQGLARRTAGDAAVSIRLSRKAAA
jgi:hypothetical protein